MLQLAEETTKGDEGVKMDEKVYDLILAVSVKVAALEERVTGLATRADLMDALESHKLDLIAGAAKDLRPVLKGLGAVLAAVAAAIGGYFVGGSTP